MILELFKLTNGFTSFRQFGTVFHHLAAVTPNIQLANADLFVNGILMRYRAKFNLRIT